MKRGRRLAIAVSVGVCAATAAMAAPSGLTGFGPNVRSAGACVSGDFDGDGRADTACLAGVGLGRAAPGVTMEDRLFGAPARGGTMLAVRIGGGTRRYLVGGGAGGFFDTPIWRAHPPLGVARRGSATFRRFQRQGAPVRNDVLVLGTEAGIDIALYWTGTRFAVFEPHEEP